MRLGGHHSEETKAKIAVGQVGHIMPEVTRVAICEAKCGESNTHWKGGKQVSNARKKAKRRTMGFVYLNQPFIGCEGHHVDNEQIINMPAKLHQSMWHCQRTGKGMAQMNAIAYNFLFKQEVEAAMTKVTS